jgi:hypothetical protein
MRMYVAASAEVSRFKPALSCIVERIFRLLTI